MPAKSRIFGPMTPLRPLALLLAAALLPACSDPSPRVAPRQIERRWTIPGVAPSVRPEHDTVRFVVGGLAEYETSRLRRLFQEPEQYWLILSQAADSTVQVNMLIGRFEAQEIAVGIERLSPQRPLPGHLLHRTIAALGYRLTYAVIDRLEGGVFKATLYLRGPRGQLVRLDSRPADAVVQVMHQRCPLYVLRDVAIASESSYY